MPMIVNLTFDVEEFDFPTEYGKEVPFETQLSVSTDGLMSILQVLEKHHAKATFYVTANYAQHKKALIQDIQQAGHEIASHDFYHAPGSKLQPKASKIALEEITGQPVLGYRSPRLAKVTVQELQEAGYRYNSSMNPTWIPSRYNNLNKPRSVYKEDTLVQYPTSVSWPFRIPLFWISFHVIPIGFYTALALSALKKDGHLNLYFHPWEFADRLKEEAFAVPAYIAKCSGTELVTKLDQLITKLKTKGCAFQTTKQYLGFDV